MSVQPRFPLRFPRLVSGALAAGLVAATVSVALRDDASGWLAVGFAIMPDLTFLAGIGQKVEKGQMPPRAVPFYNAAHSLIGPVGLLVAALVFGWNASWIGAALAWASHIMVDRTFGFGMRSKAGYLQSERARA